MTDENKPSDLAWGFVVQLLPPVGGDVERAKDVARRIDRALEAMRKAGIVVGRQEAAAEAARLRATPAVGAVALAAEALKRCGAVVGARWGVDVDHDTAHGVPYIHDGKGHAIIHGSDEDEPSDLEMAALARNALPTLARAVIEMAQLLAAVRPVVQHDADHGGAFARGLIESIDRVRRHPAGQSG